MDDRYTADEIRRYEAIYGRHFVSPGGEGTTRRFLSRVAIAADQTVLDVGCGVGGSAFYLARTYGCRVDGIDLSSEMIRTARQRAEEEGLAARVGFLQGDCVGFDYPHSDYGLVYSRDSFLHIADKPRLFDTLRGCLAPTGTLLFTDYVRGSARPGPEFAAYVEKYGYALEDIDGYRARLGAAGFEVEAAEDLTDLFIEVHRDELARLPQADLQAADRDYLAARWRQKIARAERGEQSWALFIAKPRP